MESNGSCLPTGDSALESSCHVMQPSCSDPFFYRSHLQHRIGLPPGTGHQVLHHSEQNCLSKGPGLSRATPLTAVLRRRNSSGPAGPRSHSLRLTYNTRCDLPSAHYFRSSCAYERWPVLRKAPVVVKPVTVRFGVVLLSLAGTGMRVMLEVPETLRPSNIGRKTPVLLEFAPASKVGTSSSARAVVFCASPECAKKRRLIATLTAALSFICGQLAEARALPGNLPPSQRRSRTSLPVFCIRRLLSC